MTAPSPAKPAPAPSITDMLARQALAIVDQSKALRAQLDALDAQTNALLEVVRVLQDAESQRRAAATARVGGEEQGPKMPPVFGRGPSATEEVSLPLVPPGLVRT